MGRMCGDCGLVWGKMIRRISMELTEPKSIYETVVQNPKKIDIVFSEAAFYETLGHYFRSVSLSALNLPIEPEMENGLVRPRIDFGF